MLNPQACKIDISPFNLKFNQGVYSNLVKNFHLEKVQVFLFEILGRDILKIV